MLARIDDKAYAASFDAVTVSPERLIEDQWMGTDENEAENDQ